MEIDFIFLFYNKLYHYNKPVKKKSKLQNVDVDVTIKKKTVHAMLVIENHLNIKMLMTQQKEAVIIDWIRTMHIYNV